MCHHKRYKFMKASLQCRQSQLPLKELKLKYISGAQGFHDQSQLKQTDPLIMQHLWASSVGSLPH